MQLITIGKTLRRVDVIPLRRPVNRINLHFQSKTNDKKMQFEDREATTGQAD